MLAPMRIDGDFTVNTDQIKVIKTIGTKVHIFVKNKNDSFLAFNFADEQKAEDARLKMIKHWSLK